MPQQVIGLSVDKNYLVHRVSYVDFEGCPDLSTEHKIELKNLVRNKPITLAIARLLNRGWKKIPSEEDMHYLVLTDA